MQTSQLLLVVAAAAAAAAGSRIGVWWSGKAQIAHQRANTQAAYFQSRLVRLRCVEPGVEILQRLKDDLFGRATPKKLRVRLGTHATAHTHHRTRA